MSAYADHIQRLIDGVPEIECPRCSGEGEVEHPFLCNHPGPQDECPPDPVMVDCEDCAGTGYREMTEDEMADAAEAAEQERIHGEPPVTMAEMHQAAWIESAHAAGRIEPDPFYTKGY